MKGKLFMSSLLIVVFALFLAGCSSVNNPPDEDVDQKVDQERNTEVMEDFSQLVDGNHPLEIKEFVDENIKDVSQEEASEMIDALEKSLVNNLALTADRLVTIDESNELIEIGAVDFFFDEDKINEIENEELKEEVQAIFNTGYKLINVEGTYNPIVDYAKLEEYNDHLTQEWIDYLSVNAMDSDSPPFVDAALMIDYDDLANRIIETENYLKSYPDGSRHEKMLEVYDNKLNIYLAGIPNTQIYDYDSNEIYDSAYDSYVNTSQEEDLITADVTGRYIEAIDENDKIIDDEILQLAEELTSEAVEALK